MRAPTQRSGVWLLSLSLLLAASIWAWSMFAADGANRPLEPQPPGGDAARRVAAPATAMATPDAADAAVPRRELATAAPADPGQPPPRLVAVPQRGRVLDSRGLPLRNVPVGWMR